MYVLDVRPHGETKALAQKMGLEARSFIASSLAFQPERGLAGAEAVSYWLVPKPPGDWDC